MRKADLAKQLAGQYCYGNFTECVRAIYSAKDARVYRMFQKFVEEIQKKQREVPK